MRKLFVWQKPENCDVATKNAQNLFLYQHFQPIYAVMHNEVENLTFVQLLFSDFISSLKNNATQNLLTFDN